jgi:hypothetical protein
MALILKRASVSRTSGEWREDDYDVLADGIVVGRIMKAAAAPEGTPWLWTLAYGHHEDRTPTHGYGVRLNGRLNPCHAVRCHVCRIAFRLGRVMSGSLRTASR